MKITKKLLIKLSACSYARDYFKNQSMELIDCISWLLSKKVQKEVNEKYSENSIVWANWLLPRCMKHKQFIEYAIYSAKLSLFIFEKKYKKDDRPRKAVEAAEKVLKNNTKKNRSAAESAARSARSAAESAAESAARSARSAAESAAESAAWSARSAAESARSAARSAAESAARSARSARSAAESAAWSARSARSAAESAAESAALKKIIKFGLKIIVSK